MDLHHLLFFFSSRRRHTRSDRDWSSDGSEEHTSELQSQAEDGIRDLIVTGVQTCALPIRLNSSHDQISYAVFCLKKKKRRIASAHCLTPVTIRSRNLSVALKQTRFRDLVYRLGDVCVLIMRL